MIEYADYRLVAGDSLIPFLSTNTEVREDWETCAAARWTPDKGWHQPLGHDWMYEPDDE